MVRWSSAVFCASVRVTTSWSPSARASNSRAPEPVIEKTGFATSVAAASAASMPAGLPMRMRSSSGPGVQPPHVADLVAQVAEPVAQVGPEPLQLLGVHLLGLDLHQHVRAAAQVEAEVDQPRRRPPGQSDMACSSSGVSAAPRSTASRASLACSTRP